MTGIPSYSTTAASNVQANTGVNWDEGVSPAAVNNSARQNMADMRSAFNDLAWFQYGIGDLAVATVYASGTSFTVAGADVTAVYHVGRRVRAVGSGTGTIYGYISVTSYSPTTTTVTVVWDSGSLSNETLVISLSQTPVTGNPVSANSVAWTPSVGGTATYTVQTGTYTRIGRKITFRCSLVINSIGSGSTSAISGLPFSAATITSVSIGFFTGLALSVTSLSAYVTGTAITLTGLTAAASSITDQIAALGNSARVEISGSYLV